MKLNKTKVRFILRQYRKHVSIKEISRDVKVSQRRVQQILKQYNETGLEPVLGEKVGRPAKPHDLMESEIVQAAHARYLFGARMLELVIKKEYKICISHNRIQMYLKAQGAAQEDENKQKRRNPYEPRTRLMPEGCKAWCTFAAFLKSDMGSEGCNIFGTRSR